jgi:hypothetical protein
MLKWIGEPTCGRETDPGTVTPVLRLTRGREFDDIDAPDYTFINSFHYL